MHPLTGTPIAEIRKMVPGSCHFTRATQKVVERFVYDNPVAYANALTQETGVKHYAWSVGFFDKNGNAVTTDKRGRIVSLK